MDELDQILDKAIADGLSDEDIQFIVGEWKAAAPQAMPAGATEGMMPNSQQPVGITPGPMGEAFLGAGERVEDIARGVASIPSMFKENFQKLAADPSGTIATYPGQMVEGMKGVVGGVVDTGADLLSGDPRRMGGAAVDVAAMAPGLGPAGKLAAAKVASKVPAVVAGAKAVGKVATIPRIIDTTAGLMSSHPIRNTFRGATGQGPASRLDKYLFPDAKAAAGAAPVNPNAGGTLRPRSGVEASLEADMRNRVEGALPRPVPGVVASPSPSPAVRVNGRPLAEVEGAGTEAAPAWARGVGTPRPSPNAGGRLAPSSSQPNPLKEMLEELRRTEGVGIAPSHPTGGGFTTPPPISQPAGGRLVPGGARPNIVQEVVDDVARPVPSHPTQVTVPQSAPGGAGMRTVKANQNAIRQMRPQQAPTTTPPPTRNTGTGSGNGQTNATPSMMEKLLKDFQASKSEMAPADFKATLDELTEGAYNNPAEVARVQDIIRRMLNGGS